MVATNQLLDDLNYLTVIYLVRDRVHPFHGPRQCSIDKQRLVMAG